MSTLNNALLGAPTAVGQALSVQSLSRLPDRREVEIINCGGILQDGRAHGPPMDEEMNAHSHRAWRVRTREGRAKLVEAAAALFNEILVRRTPVRGVPGEQLSRSDDAHKVRSLMWCAGRVPAVWFPPSARRRRDRRLGVLEAQTIKKSAISPRRGAPFGRIVSSGDVHAEQTKHRVRPRYLGRWLIFQKLIPMLRAGGHEVMA
jgi:hypothetical protein